MKDSVTTAAVIVLMGLWMWPILQLKDSELAGDGDLQRPDKLDSRVEAGISTGLAEEEIPEEEIKLEPEDIIVPPEILSTVGQPEKPDPLPPVEEEPKESEDKEEVGLDPIDAGEAPQSAEGQTKNHTDLPVHINPPLTPPVKLAESDYERRWRTMRIRETFRDKAAWSVNKINKNWDRYSPVARATGVPPYVIAVLHNMEASLRFDKHLHNGNPLTKRTYWVPKGRPPYGNPPFTWEESAKDALWYDDLDRVEDWSLHHMLYTIERYNGTGYLKYHKDVPTPYLWSGSQHYVRGKYVSDGKWSSTAVSKQVGAAVILKMLDEGGHIDIE